jgi:hypothetical protein
VTASRATASGHGAGVEEPVLAAPVLVQAGHEEPGLAEVALLAARVLAPWREPSEGPRWWVRVVLGSGGQPSRSTTVALASPPPSHMVSRP